MKGVRGQAAAEFAIVVPLFLLMFTGLWQFSDIMKDRITLLAVEREAMRFLTDEGDHKKELKEFVEEAAEKMGLAGDISVSLTDSEAASDDTKLNIFRALWGVTMTIKYEKELMGPFRALTGKETIAMSTKLATGAGGSFTVKIGSGIDGLLKKGKDILGKDTGYRERRQEDDTPQ